MKPGAGDKQMSKAALKNQRRREAKKAAKQVVTSCPNASFCIQDI